MSGYTPYGPDPEHPGLYRFTVGEDGSYLLVEEPTPEVRRAVADAHLALAAGHQPADEAKRTITFWLAAMTERYGWLRENP